MGLMDKINQQAEEYGTSAGGKPDMFDFDRPGLYRLRLLTEPEVLATHFFGKGSPSHVCYGKDKGCKFHDAGAPKDEKGNPKRPSIKLVCYVIDREHPDKGVQLAELPLSLSYALNDLEADPDFEFSEYPMPYDVKINHDPDNKDPKAKYRLTPSPKREVLTDEESAALADRLGKMTPAGYVEKRKRKQMEKDGMIAPPAEANYEDVPYPQEDLGEGPDF